MKIFSKTFRRIREICNGWTNLLFPRGKVKGFIKLTGASRMKICNECEYNSGNCKNWTFIKHCTICKCPLRAKVKCLICECPDSPPRWKAIFLETEE